MISLSKRLEFLSLPGEHYGLDKEMAAVQPTEVGEEMIAACRSVQNDIGD